MYMLWYITIWSYPKQHLYAWEEEDNDVPTYKRAPHLETLVPFYFATFYNIGEGYYGRQPLIAYFS